MPPHSLSSTLEAAAVWNDALPASLPSPLLSANTSGDEPSEGVPLDFYAMEASDEMAAPPLDSSSDAQDVQSPPTISTDYQETFDIDSRASSADTDNEPGVRLDTGSASSQAQASHPGGGIGLVSSQYPTTADGLTLRTFVERVLGTVGTPIPAGLAQHAFDPSVLSTVEQVSFTNDARAATYSTGSYNSLRLQSYIAAKWSSFFDYFEPDAIYDANGPSKNLSVAAFLRAWSDRRVLQKPNRTIGIDYIPRISARLQVTRIIEALPQIVKASDLSMDACNLQGLDLEDLGTTQQAVREARRRTYLHHTNLMNTIIPQYADLHGLSRYRRHTSADGKTWKADYPDIPRHDNHFRFREMNLRTKPCLTHFQLRNMLSASSKNAVFYAGERMVHCLNPETGHEATIMHFKGPRNDFEGLPMGDIGTLTATHDLLIVGGFSGQYAMKSLFSSNDDEYVRGRITAAEDGSTNHIHTFLARQSGLPQAVFCSNDARVRILDCYSNKIISEQRAFGKDESQLGWAINCSATSPDGRLRLQVGDQTHPWIVAADTGEHLASLPNHQDFGFACDWSPDGVHVATGNQDGIVQIFDCRNWTQPIQILPTELGGVRTMKFSPLGSGKRVLAMAEPADYVSIVDAETFKSKQRFEFLGEIGGLSFTPDGAKLFVANTDQDFGGILEFDRAGDGQRYGLARSRQSGGWVVDEDLLCPDDQMLQSITTRRRRWWGVGEVRV